MNRSQFLRLLAAGTAGLSAGLFTGCTADAQPPASPRHGAWMRGAYPSLDEWRRTFARLRTAGLHDVLIDQSPETLRQIVPIAREEGLAPHAWMFTMMRGENVEAHPEWYAVNRAGESTATAPPYVDYYRFMCPSREPVLEYLEGVVRERAAIDGLASVHLDYIRFPDVILPISLQPTYGLNQDKEYPEFDYCYCEVCRAKFEEQAGVDPLELEDPPTNAEWVQFRYDRITNVVNRLSAVAHAADTLITAAVFPTPTIARTLVRQDWPNWPLDGIMPMQYQNFYEEDIAWIGEGVREGLAALDGRIPLYSGLYIPELSPAELAQAAETALTAGASGIVLFEHRAPTEAHWRELQAVIG